MDSAPVRRPGVSFFHRPYVYAAPAQPFAGVVLLFLFFAGIPGMSLSTVLLTRGIHGTGGSQTINFYGVALPFTPFFCFVYASFAAWFILALERNIKRDP